MHWHYCLGHSAFMMLKALAIIRIFPCCLAKAQTPMCPACSFAKIHQEPWRTKGQHKGNVRKRITRPGQCVSVDQQESSQAGFFAQLKGRLTRNQYTATNNLCGSLLRFEVHPFYDSGDISGNSLCKRML